MWGIQGLGAAAIPVTKKEGKGRGSLNPRGSLWQHPKPCQPDAEQAAQDWTQPWRDHLESRVGAGSLQTPDTSTMTTAGILVLLSFALCCVPDTAFGIEVDCSSYPNITNEEGREVLVCSDVVRPICGSNRITYGHECLLCAYNKEYGTNFSKDHDGECKEAAPVDCSRYPNTTSEEGKVVLLCSQDPSPVCGTNWVTYDNECHLCARNLESGTNVGKKTDGECKKEIVTVDCSDYPKPVCPGDYMPVCGSDSTTYNNKCTFCNAVVDSNGTTTLSHFGKC